MTDHDRTSRRILLVEDNEDSADMLSRRLRSRGFEVTVVHDGGAAVEACRATPPDIVLMDMSLPVMDGWSAVTAIRSDAALDRVGIIALTAHTMREDVARAHAVGCDDFHGKPVVLAKLVEQIERLVRAKLPRD